MFIIYAKRDIIIIVFITKEIKLCLNDLFT